MARSNLYLLLCGVLTLLLLGCGGEPPLDPVSPPSNRIKAHLDFLAADKLGGRMTGTPGIAMAEEYIVDRFREAGLSSPVGFEEYRQGFPLYGAPWDFSSQVAVGGVTATLGADFAPLFFSGVAEIEAPLIFVGYGIRAPEYGWDDYAGLEVEGKLVLALRHEPEEKDPSSVWKGTEFTDHATFLKKAELARSLGAAGFATFTDPLHHEGEESFHISHGMSLSPRESTAPLNGFPALIINRETARAALEPILSREGIDLTELQLRVERGEDFGNPRGRRISIKLKRGEAPVIAHNLGALYSSAKPEARPTVLLGAHYDHLGGRISTPDGSDGVFNGADDNASGTAVLLGLVERVAEEEPPLGVNLLFVAFSAEELGLFGSRYFAGRNRATEGLDLMINFDMVGRNRDEPMQAILQGLEEDPLKLLRSSAERSAMELKFEEDSGADSSDHAPFRNAEVPTLFFFSGFHDQYHRLDDEEELVEVERLEALVETVYRFLIESYTLKPSM